MSKYEIWKFLGFVLRIDKAIDHIREMIPYLGP